MTFRFAPHLAVRLLLPAISLGVPALAQLGCHASVDAAVPQGDGVDGRFPTTIDHEPCDASSRGAQSLDANGDGKPDLIRVAQGGREVCRVLDLNHDGKPDAFLYYDGAGQVRRKEFDFDRDGRVDEIDRFEGGALVRKDRETNLDGKLDTWDFYQGGKLVSRSRDADGDGKIDQWWRWPNPDKPECALIDSDRDGDGRADPGGTIDLCAEAADAGALPAPAAAKSADGKPDAGAATGEAAAPLPPPAAAPADAGAARGDQ